MALDHKSLRRQAMSQHTDRISSRRGESPGDAVADKARIERAISQHDKQLHGGKKTKLALKDGGHCEGGRAGRRLDRPGRADGGSADSPMNQAVLAALADKLTDDTPTEYARGGGTKMGGKKRAGNVNVIVAAGGEKERPVPVPVPMGGAATPPPKPPMPPGAGMGGPAGMGAPPPGMGGPMGAPAMRPPMMRANGGSIPKMSAGAHSGLGRMQKARMKILDENAGVA